MASKQPHFTAELFAFLRELADDNDRDWFVANKARFEQHVREPLLQFIGDFAPKLEKISDHMVADPRKQGGSMFRINRDIRFSKDKRPYKENVGAHFRHEAGKDAHAPGFYLHLEPGRVFCGGGIWHPDGPALLAIRTAIVEDSAGWKKVLGGRPFKRDFGGAIAGDSLKRPPRGFDADHPYIDDIKRKDFFALAELDEQQVLEPGFIDVFAGLCKSASGLTGFLAKALDLPY
jgi:uncharacterized protein (TIGR02453 family)